MKELARAPYNLNPGDLINYKLYTLNKVGESEEQCKCIIKEMKDTNPPQVSAPTLARKDDTEFDVQFKSVIGNETLKCFADGSPLQWKESTKLGMNYHTIQIDSIVNEYTCEVHAETECGGLGKSGILVVKNTKPPGCPNF